LYAGAIKRGRSVRTLVAAGLAGVKVSFGHAATFCSVLNVGVENAAALVCRRRKSISYPYTAKVALLTVDGYTGSIHSKFVAVGKRPRAFFALTAELAAAGLPPPPPLELVPPSAEALLEWRAAREPRTPPRIAPTATRTKRGRPNLSQGLMPRLPEGAAAYGWPWARFASWRSWRLEL
jgi:hypothetical protein